MARRDDALFAEFVTARSGALFRTAYLLVGDHGLAQDLLQEGLTKTYVAWPRLRDVRRRRGLRTEGDHHHRHLVVAPEVVAQRAAQRDGAGPCRRRGHRPRHPRVALAGGATSACRQRAAVVLRYYEDLTEQQTADTMGCALGTVKSQVSAGLRKLREQVGDLVELDSEYGEVSRA